MDTSLCAAGGRCSTGAVCAAVGREQARTVGRSYRRAPQTEKGYSREIATGTKVPSRGHAFSVVCREVGRAAKRRPYEGYDSRCRGDYYVARNGRAMHAPTGYDGGGWVSCSWQLKSSACN